eukprot:364320-Chlamydomonas_euryale.AAC.9
MHARPLSQKPEPSKTPRRPEASYRPGTPKAPGLVRVRATRAGNPWGTFLLTALLNAGYGCKIQSPRCLNPNVWIVRNGSYSQWSLPLPYQRRYGSGKDHQQ